MAEIERQSKFRNRRIGGQIGTSPMNRGSGYQGRPLSSRRKNQPIAPAQAQADSPTPSGPATTPASGNVLNQRQNLYNKMKTMKPGKESLFRDRASSLGVTDSGWNKAMRSLGREPAQTQQATTKKKASKPTAAGGDLTAQAMGSPKQQAVVRKMMEEGSGVATASNSSGITKTDVSAEDAMSRSGKGGAAGQRVLLTPEQKKDDARASSLKDLPTDVRMRVQGRTNQGPAQAAANQRAAQLGLDAGLTKQRQLHSKFRERPMTVPQGNVLVDKGGKAPAGMELAGMRSGGRMLYAPIKEVYGQQPTGAGTRAMNAAKNATGIGTPKAVQTAETIRSNYQVENQDRRFTGKINRDQSTQVSRPGAFKAEAPAASASNATQGSSFRNRGQQPNKAWDRYSPDVYKRTDEARATGFRRQAAEKAVRQGGSDAMSPEQRKEFGKMYGDTKMAESAGITQKPTNPTAYAPRAAIPSEQEYSDLAKSGTPWRVKAPGAQNPVQAKDKKKRSRFASRSRR